MGELVDCRPIQEAIKKELKQEIERLNITPRLIIIQVGEDFASTKYVNQKVKHAVDIGMLAHHLQLKEDSSTEDVIDAIEEIQDLCDGLIVQLPLPKHINQTQVLDSIDPRKDADCLNVWNVGLLHTGNPVVKPCTAEGVMKIFKHHKYSLNGKSVLIIGRGYMTGYPLFNLMLQENATVSMAHSKTDIEYYLETMEWDVIVTSIGKPKHFKTLMAEWIIDVGINYDKNGKMCGDVNNVLCCYSYCTPVPNGVGRLTTAVLLENTLTLAKRRRNLI